MTMGDPAGCGPQITSKTWRLRKEHDLATFFVIADPRVFEGQCPVGVIDNPNQAFEVFDTALPVLPISIGSEAQIAIGRPSAVYADSIIQSIETATQLCLDGKASAVVTNPISKAVLYEAGFAFPGHTEFIASLCSTSETPLRPVMMLVGGGLRVSLATIHVPLMKVMDHLTADLLTEVATITHKALVLDFGLSSPRIAFTGLNPHAGEDGKIGTEERDLINPVATTLRAQGVQITDAKPGDTVFHEALNGAYDAVIAMTHDQGLIPVKTLDMWGGVNTTLGLPIVRTSPDHGTAYDAAATGNCRPDSLIAALKLANDMTLQREAANEPAT